MPVILPSWWLSWSVRCMTRIYILGSTSYKHPSIRGMTTLHEIIENFPGPNESMNLSKMHRCSKKRRKKSTMVYVEELGKMVQAGNIYQRRRSWQLDIQRQQGNNQRENHPAIHPTPQIDTIYQPYQLNTPDAFTKIPKYLRTQGVNSDIRPDDIDMSYADIVDCGTPYDAGQIHEATAQLSLFWEQPTKLGS